MAKIFIGFNFSADCLFSRKIVGFRKRFDPKYNQYSFPHMSMLAPIEIDETQVDDLQETLKEELETFFYGVNAAPKLGFTGVGVNQHKRRNMLYLNPHYSTDLEYCSEVVLDICKSFAAVGGKYKENQKQFLPLGVFKNPNELQIVMEHAQLEFTSFSELPIESISLYQKQMGIWFEKEILIDFEQKDSVLLQLKEQTI
jgi:hypothetical protein